MSCNNCFNAQPIPRCTDQIIVGTIADINASVIVYFKAPGNINAISTTSSGAGLITLDTSAIEFMESTYKITIFTTSDPSTPLDITLSNAEVFDCIEVSFTDGSATSAILRPKA